MPDFIARARALVPVLDAAGARIDAAKSLPTEVLDALHDAQMFRMLLPRSMGGAEVDLQTFFEVVLLIAQGDGSAAWSVTQSSGCALSAAYMEPAAAHEIFGDSRAVLSWGFPMGPCQMRPVEGGWRVTGTWGFGSGSRHSSFVGGHCQVLDTSGAPLVHSNGQPVQRTALMPRSAITIVDDSWDVIGLRGTGSDSYGATDLFVPARHCVVGVATGRDQQRAEDAIVEPEPERREAGVLYRFSPTTVYQSGFAAVALGLARRLLDDFVVLAARKAPSNAGYTLRDNATIQERVAISHARLEAATAFVRQCLRDGWAQAASGGRHEFRDRVNIRLASTHGIREAAKVAEETYRDAGATAIFASNPFERRFRDIHAAAQQVQAQAVHLQTVGQYLLGLKPSTRFM